MNSPGHPEMADLLLIGEGVNGAGVARDASGRGLSVVLCDKGDLAEGTSSRSGRLIDGGLRYLERGEFRLVREALAEREVLLAAAPHMVRPMRFVLPHSPNDRPAWMILIGLLLHDHLGGRRKLPGARGLDLRSDPEDARLLDCYFRGFAYSDCWVDDSRLVILSALDAAERGARILPRHAFAGARRDEGLWRVELREERTGEIREMRARGQCRRPLGRRCDILRRGRESRARNASGQGSPLRPTLAASACQRARPVHQLALHPARLAHATNGSLYPDHVIFCGVGTNAVEPPLPNADGAPVFLLVSGIGAAMRVDSSPGARALANCLGDVLSRTPADASLTYLTSEQNAELLD